jgi:hypothetical protein
MRDGFAESEKSSLRANGSRECAPDDRLREAIQKPQKQPGLLRRLRLLAMTGLIELKTAPR